MASETRLRWTRSRSFRANPNYVLLSADALSQTQLSQFGDLAKDPEFYGVLTPREDSKLSIKAIQSGDALLFLHLQRQGPIPEYFSRSHPSFVTYIDQLLLDSVLELEVDGAFLSGPALLQAGDAPSVHAESISDRALLYAVALRLKDPLPLAARLYSYNRIPAEISQIQAFLNRNVAKQFLGLTPDSEFAGFYEQQPSDESSCWLQWARARGHRTTDSPFKLYFCVYPEDLPSVFSPCANIVGQHGAFCFKIGADRLALNRPDKFVAYFNERSDLQACIRDLSSVLSNLKPHELPFTGALPIPALTWGVDPPQKEKPAAYWLQSGSWRIWVARKLASALILAADNGCSPTEAIRFAKDRVALEGIDPATWAPEGVSFA